MINHSENTTTVKFGSDGKATVGLHAKDNQLTIRVLNNERTIGDNISSDDVDELPKVVLQFQDMASVEALIKALGFIIRPYPSICYAS